MRERSIHFLESYSHFSISDKEKITKSVDNLLLEIGDKISFKKFDICFSYDNEQCLEEGLGLRIFNESTIFVFLMENKEWDEIEENFKELFTYELVHLARAQQLGWAESYEGGLLEAMVVEGLAGHFLIELFNNKSKAWFNNVDDKDMLLKKLEKEIKKKFDNQIHSHNHNLWFFGSNEKEIPMWAGYSLGFYIVGEYLKRSGSLASEVISIPSKKIHTS